MQATSIVYSPYPDLRSAAMRPNTRSEFNTVVYGLDPMALGGYFACSFNIALFWQKDARSLVELAAIYDCGVRRIEDYSAFENLQNAYNYERDIRIQNGLCLPAWIDHEKKHLAQSIATFTPYFGK